MNVFAVVSGCNNNEFENGFGLYDAYGVEYLCVNLIDATSRAADVRNNLGYQEDTWDREQGLGCHGFWWTPIGEVEGAESALWVAITEIPVESS